MTSRARGSLGSSSLVRDDKKVLLNKSASLSTERND